MTSIEILLTSRCSYFINKIQSLAGQCDDIRLISQTADVSLLPQLMAARQADILLLNISTPDSDIIDILREIHLRSPTTKSLICNHQLNDEFIDRALAVGAKGFLWDTCSPHTYIKAIRAVHAGDIWLSRKVLVSLLESLLPVTGHKPAPSPSNPLQRLTRRESEIAVQVTEGLSNKEIAKRLGISDKTVKVHLDHIYHKLQINRRTQLLHRLHPVH